MSLNTQIHFHQKLYCHSAPSGSVLVVDYEITPFIANHGISAAHKCGIPVVQGQSLYGGGLFGDGGFPRGCYPVREIQFCDSDGRQTKLHEHRFVSMAQPHLAGLHLELIAENWSGELEIRSAIDGRVINNNVKRYEPYNQQHLEPIATGTLEPAGIWLNTRTSHIASV